MIYPVKYFNCKSLVEDDVEAFFASYVAFFSQIGAYWGEVKGETGIPGLRLDFNNGLRLQVPAGDWYVHIHDYVHEIDYFKGTVQKVILVSVEKYFIHWQIDVYQEDRLVFSISSILPGSESILFSAVGDWGIIWLFCRTSGHF